MSRLIDIKKQAFPEFEYYTPVADSYVQTPMARLRQITPFGHQVIERYRSCFGSLTPTLVCKIQRQEEILKPQLCDRFGYRDLQAGTKPQAPSTIKWMPLPGRMFNLALNSAHGLIQGTTESMQAHLDDTQRAIERQNADILEAYLEDEREQVPGMQRKLLRLENQERSLQQKLQRPSIHFRKEIFCHQDRTAWKKAYQEARSDRFGALGSKDEIGGNSTFCLRPVRITENGRHEFAVSHQQQVIDTFCLEAEQGQELERILSVNLTPFQYAMAPSRQDPQRQVRQKISVDRMPITVWFIRHKRQWYLHVSYEQAATPIGYELEGYLGVDLNCTSLAWAHLLTRTQDFTLEGWGKRTFDPSWSKTVKQNWFYEEVNAWVQYAKAHRAAIVMEYLDFEGCKRWLNTKLGQMLRVFPYRKLRQIIERKCLEQGVILRFVAARFTSAWGAVLSQLYPQLGRDEAAEGDCPAGIA